MQSDQLQTEHGNQQTELVGIQVQQNYTRQLRDLQDEILSIYFDIFLFYFSMFFLNSYVSWKVSFNFPLIFLIVIKILGMYIVCKLDNRGTCLNTTNLLDKFLQIIMLLHLLLTYNHLANDLIVTAIVFLVFGILFTIVYAKSFFCSQPFFSYFLLCNTIAWIIRIFFSIALVQFVKIIFHEPNSDFQEIYVLFIVLHYGLLIVTILLALDFLCSFILKYPYKKLSVIIRGKLLLILTILGITLVVYNFADLLDSQKTEQQLIQANYSLVFLIVYYSFNFLFLIIEYQTFSYKSYAFHSFREFFHYCHHSYNQIYSITRIQPSEQQMASPKIREIATQGILRVTLQKISKTFFKIEQVNEKKEKKEKKKKEKDKEKEKEESKENKEIQQLKQIEKKESENENQSEKKRQFLKTRISQKEDEQQEFQQESQKSSKENQKCIVCFDADANAMFYPCGHGGMCYDCSKILFEKQSVCSLCRCPIKSIIKYELEEGKKEKYQIVSVSTKVR